MKRQRETLYTPSPKNPPKLNFEREKTLFERFRSPLKRPKLDFNLANTLFAPIAPQTTGFSLENKLQSAMRHANSECGLGASNKMVDIFKTNGWTWGLRFHHSKGYYQNVQQRFYTQRDLNTNIHYSEKFETDGTLIREFSDIERWQWYFHQPLPAIIDESIEEVAPNSISKEVLNLIPYQKNKDPLNDPDFNISPEIKEFFGATVLAKDMRYGNCGIRSALVFDWLWRHPEGIKRIEYIHYSFDHACLFVNREDDTLHTGWVIDPWWEDGKIYPVSEFMEKLPQIKDYCEQQTRERYELLGFVYERMDELHNNIEDLDEPMVYEVLNEIQPEIDKYPAYDKYMSVSDYYFTSNVYPADIVSDLEKLQETHKQKFHAVLTELKQHHGFFSSAKSEKSNDSKKLLSCMV